VPHGELYSLIHNHSGRHLPWTFIQRAAKELAIGLQFMHGKKIAHLDLKSPNIMIGNMEWCPPTNHVATPVAVVALDASAPSMLVSPRTMTQSANQLILQQQLQTLTANTNVSGTSSHSTSVSPSQSSATLSNSSGMALSPANTFVTPTFAPSTKPIIKIADFGVSKEIQTFITGRFVTNPIWLAPEILMNHRYDLKVDVYAFGMLLFLLTFFFFSFFLFLFFFFYSFILSSFFFFLLPFLSIFVSFI
jgi:serine/threonine protein kinase